MSQPTCKVYLGGNQSTTSITSPIQVQATPPKPLPSNFEQANFTVVVGQDIPNLHGTWQHFDGLYKFAARDSTITLELTYNPDQPHNTITVNQYTRNLIKRDKLTGVDKPKTVAAIAPANPTNPVNPGTAATAQVKASPAETFYFGDSQLISVELTLAEDKLTSSCSITIADPERKLANKYMTAAYALGGIALPDPLMESEAVSPQTTATPSTEPIGGACGAPDMSRWGEAFVKLANDLAALPAFAPQNPASKAALAFALTIAVTETRGILKPDNIYTVLGGSPKDMLGWGQIYRTVHKAKISQWSTPNGYNQLMSEWIRGKRPLPNGAKAKDFGALLAANPPTTGAGYISWVKSQISIANWQGLHDGWSRNVGFADFMVEYLNSSADTCTAPTQPSAGTYTLKRIKGVSGNYIALRDQPAGSNYSIAYQTANHVATTSTNPTLRADTVHTTVATATDEVFDSLQVDPATDSITVTLTKTNATPPPTTEPTSTPQPTIATEPGIIELSAKGTLVTIELGFHNSNDTAVFKFIHNGTKISSTATEGSVVTLTGTTVRWFLGRLKRNTIYRDVTIKQLAGKFAQDYGLNLVMDSEGPRLPYVDQRGETDHNTLQRVLDTQGYRLYDLGNSLVIDQYNPKDRQAFNVYYHECLTVNIDDIAQTSAIAPNTNYSAGETKFNLATWAGKLEQLAPLTPKQATVTGSNVAPTRETTLARNASNNNQAGGGQVANLLDIVGTAERSPTKPAKEFRGSLTMVTSPAALLLATPDTPFKFIGFMPWLEENTWLIESVTHNYSASGAVTTINFFLPTAAKRIAPATQTPSATTAPANQTTPVLTAGSKNERIFKAINAVYGTSSINGPGAGNVSCAWILHKFVFPKAGLPAPSKSDSVREWWRVLKGGAGIQVPVSEAMPGDLILWRDPNKAMDRHIAVVTGKGASEILGNSSSRAAIVWRGNLAAYNAQYRGSTVEVWRVR